MHYVLVMLIACDGETHRIHDQSLFAVFEFGLQRFESSEFS